LVHINIVTISTPGADPEFGKGGRMHHAERGGAHSSKVERKKE